MPRIFVKERDIEGADQWWLRRDQFTIGLLYVDEKIARWIERVLQEAASKEDAPPFLSG